MSKHVFSCLAGSLEADEAAANQTIIRLSIVRDVGTHRLVDSVPLVDDQLHQKIFDMRLGAEIEAISLGGIPRRVGTL